MLQAMAVDIALAEGIDEVLFLRLITQESSWIVDAGADVAFPACIGLAQLNEKYGRWFIGMHGVGLVDKAELALVPGDEYWTEERVRDALLDPEVSLTIGARELKRLLAHRWFRDWQTTLAAWNYGAGNVRKLMVEYPDKWMAHLPAETQWMLATVLLKDGVEEYGGRR